LNFPVGLPEELGVMGLIFADIGTLYNTGSSATNIYDETTLRASAGFGISWLSPFGPVKFYLSKAILKENYDKKEIFRFSFGTTY
jgi:outer membrane protein insertion porin family